MSAAGCGGGTKKVASPVVVAPPPTRATLKKKKKKVVPVCVAQTDQAVIGMSAADGDLVQFCVADGNGDSKCYGVELGSKKWQRLERPPIPQVASLEPPVAHLRSTPHEVEVCAGSGDDACNVLKPRVKKAENPIEAAVNGAGTYVAMMLGDAESGKGYAEVWSVAKKKKVGTIKYAKGDYQCGTAHVVDDLVFVSAGLCAGPSARGALYNAKGKKLADVGGADFGTYGTVPVQIGPHRWAFLSETGGVIAIHDSSTGKLEKTIDLLSLWAPAGGGASGGGDAGDDGGSSDDAAPATGGNPGESALLRGADGKLLVVTGSPHPGNIGIVDVDGGTVDVVAARPCAEGEAPPAAGSGSDDAGSGDSGSDDGGSDDGDSGSDDGDSGDSGGGAKATAPDKPDSSDDSDADDATSHPATDLD
ncbi:MAG TPA: hypothetical protein VHE35_09155 [Kofleriaceae bacterium]|nr:hypothetical protein [Kofleriaceae bacterium]